MRIFNELGISNWSLSANFVGFAVAGLMGLIAQLVIGRYYGATTLGLFNQSFALYLLLSQLGVLGLHIYAQRESAIVHESKFDKKLKQGTVSSSSLFLTICISTLVVMIVNIFTNELANLFNSIALAKFIHYILPAIWCLAINKVLLGITLGHKRFSVYAIGQAGRPLLFLFFVFFVVLTDLPQQYVCAALAASEMVVLFLLCVIVRKELGITPQAIRQMELGRALKFGAAAFPATFASVANSRVDIIILGLYVNDHKVGVYSAAILFIDALIQIPVVLRALFNPALAVNLENRRFELVIEHLYKVGNWARGLVGIGIFTVFLLFPYLSVVILGDEMFREAQLPFIIIGLGLLLASRWLPADQLLAQAGYPGRHSIQKLSVLTCTLILVAMLVPFYGITGAAVGYGFSFAAYGLIFKYLVKNAIALKF